MPAALGLSTSTDLDRALDLATAAALDGLAREEPDSLLVFISAAHGRLPPALGRRLESLAGASDSALCQVEGLLTSEGDLLRTPAVAAVALCGLGGAVHAFEHGRGREVELGEELLATFGPFAETDLLLVLTDAGGLDPRSLAAGLAGCAPATVLGLGVAGPAGEPAGLFQGMDRLVAGAVAVHLRAPRQLSQALAAGAVLGEPRKVSSARGNWLFRLEGVSALDEFRDASGALWDDEERALRSVLVALPPRPGADPDPALARQIVGLDRKRGAIALAEPLPAGATIAFARRDSGSALEALSRATDGVHAARGPDGLGLAVSCASRGKALFGHGGIESGYLSRAFGPDAWLGLVGSYQLAARAGEPAGLLTHATAFAHLS